VVEVVGSRRFESFHLFSSHRGAFEKLSSFALLPSPPGGPRWPERCPAVHEPPVPEPGHLRGAAAGQSPGMGSQHGSTPRVSQPPRRAADVVIAWWPETVVV
jgi:hypothetical protein